MCVFTLVAPAHKWKLVLVLAYAAYAKLHLNAIQVAEAARSPRTCVLPAQRLCFQKLSPLAQTSVDPFLLELQAEGSGAKQITEPCGIFMIPTARKTVKLDRDTLP